MKLTSTRPDNLFNTRQTEGDKEQTRLIDVVVVLIDYDDVSFSFAIEAPEAIRHERTARAASENHDLRHQRRPFRQPDTTAVA
jgi:hypothetical protein